MLKRFIGITAIVSCLSVVGVQSQVNAVACGLSGAGTSSEPYLVSSATDLAAVGKDCALTAHYKQTANITLAPPAAGQSNHEPIGTGPNYFDGVYDGAGFTISGMTIRKSLNDAVGMFGQAQQNAVLRNIGLINVEIDGGYDVGGLVGYFRLAPNAIAASKIEKSYVTGSVSGKGQVGGLAGSPNGVSISNSYSTASVHASEFGGGGLAGASTSHITNSYSVGSVTGPTDVYGFVAYNYGGGTVTNSFWDKETSGQSLSAAGDGFSTAEMKTFTTFGTTAN